MRPVWHPLSALLLEDPPAYATAHLLRLLLRAEPETRVRYAGDRMWPALRHGDLVRLVPHEGSPIVPGTVVAACPAGIPDLLRVEGREADGTLRLVADADPAPADRVPAAEVLAIARSPLRRVGPARRRLRRAWLDLAEAWRGRPDAAPDPAGTVRDKYESQAPFYTRSGAEDLEQPLLARLRARLPAGGRVLVVGSGTGRECFALAAAGYRVEGIDFAPAMVAQARAEAERRGLAVEFTAADVREWTPSGGGLAGVLFTYDVYSFIPQRAARIAVLRRLGERLDAGGAVFLSARRLRSGWERAVLTVQWLRALGHGGGEWGRTHTRWISPGGRLRRSFVQVFAESALGREAARAGFDTGPWEGGHACLAPRRRGAPATIPA